MQTTTLNIRNIDAAAAQAIKQAAAARGMTLAEYIAALSALHEAMRARADAGDNDVQAELTALGLQTVTR